MLFINYKIVFVFFFNFLLFNGFILTIFKLLYHINIKNIYAAFCFHLFPDFSDVKRIYIFLSKVEWRKTRFFFYIFFRSKKVTFVKISSRMIPFTFSKTWIVVRNCLIPSNKHRNKLNIFVLIKRPFNFHIFFLSTVFKL